MTDRPQIRASAGEEPNSARELIVHCGFKQRPIRDGGGKPSPGRFRPGDRPEARLKDVGSQIMQALPSEEDFRLSLEMVKQGHKEHPFSDECLERIRRVMDPCKKHEVEPGQPFYLSLISDLAKRAGDVDWEFPAKAAQGVPLGVDERTWTTPGVWPTKSEMRGCDIEEDDPPAPTTRENYSSAELHAEDLLATFMEEVQMGMVEGPLTLEEAAALCECTEAQICTGSLGAVEESDKIRTVFDGSIIFVNQWIQKNTTEKTTCPTVQDLLWALSCLRHGDSGPGLTAKDGLEGGAGASGPDAPPSDWTILKLDVSKAHRRIKVQRSSWKYQVAKLNGRYFVNKVGTYGIASAQLYWGRMAALLLRLLYSLFPWLPWGFVYVDDFAFLLQRQGSCKQAMAIAATLLALGCPLSWHKTVLASVNTWLGFQVDVDLSCCRMAPRKHSLVMTALDDLLKGENFHRKQLEELVGRLTWASWACPLSKPFLQPFYAWMYKVKVSGRPGMLVRMITRLLQVMLNEQPLRIHQYSKFSAWTGASDAGASEDHTTIGGWLCNGEPQKKKDVHWFLLDIDAASFGWILTKSTVSGSIPALELLGSLILFRFLAMQAPGSHSAPLYMPMTTDNMGNAMSVLNFKSKVWPSSAMMMEFVALAHRFAVVPQLKHVVRERNTWADDLTNHRVSGFCPHKKLEVDLSDDSWVLLPELLKLGAQGV